MSKFIGNTRCIRSNPKFEWFDDVRVRYFNVQLELTSSGRVAAIHWNESWWVKLPWAEQLQAIASIEATAADYNIQLDLRRALQLFWEYELHHQCAVPDGFAEWYNAESEPFGLDTIHSEMLGQWSPPS